MKKIILSILLLLLLFSFFSTKAFSSEIDYESVDFPEPEKGIDISSLVPILEKGSIVIIHSGKTKFITGMVLINAPLDDVWRVVTDYEKYHEFVPNVSRLKTTESWAERMNGYPISGTQFTEYRLGFKAFGLFSFTIVYTLEQHFDKKTDEGLIWGCPAPKGEQAFSEVYYRERYKKTNDGRTVMIYTAYANLASFGLLSKLVFKSFPELQVPALVATSTLFPEAIKERVEKIKLIVEPKEVDADNVKVPEPIQISTIEHLLKKYKKIIISWYPDKNLIRFFSAYSYLPVPKDKLKTVITDFENWKRFFRIAKSAEKSEYTDNGFFVNFSLRYKLVFPINFNYTVKYRWVDTKQCERLYFELDRSKPKDIEGEWGAWDFYDLGNKSVLGYTVFSDLRSGSLLFKVLMDNLQGFGIGLKVGLTSALIEAFSSPQALR